MSAANPYAPPKASVEASDGVADIDRLPVSDSWKRRFKAMHKAGGWSLPHLKNLSAQERKDVPAFNLLAFLFGPLYYFAKGMWKKGLTLFALCLIGIVLIDLILELAGLGKFARATGFVSAAVYATFASRDYYSKMVLGQNGWWWK